VVLCAEDGIYGVDIPKNVWHKLESLSQGVLSSSAKKARLCRMRKKEFL